MTIAITNLSAIRTPGSISSREINERGVRIAAGLCRLNRADAVEVLPFARGLVLEYTKGSTESISKRPRSPLISQTFQHRRSTAHGVACPCDN